LPPEPAFCRLLVVFPMRVGFFKPHSARLRALLSMRAAMKAAFPGSPPVGGTDRVAGGSGHCRFWPLSPGRMQRACQFGAGYGMPIVAFSFSQ